MYPSRKHLVSVSYFLKVFYTEHKTAPALPAILPYRSVFFNGTLDYPSPFRGTPNPSLDAAWETLVQMNSSPNLLSPPLFDNESNRSYPQWKHSASPKKNTSSSGTH